MIKIYHNSRCSKSNLALTYLQQEGIPFEVVNYLEEKPSVADLTSLVEKLGVKPHDLIRTKEAIYVEHYKGKTLTDDEWLLAIHDNPILLERPILVNGDRAMVARTREAIISALA